MAAASGAAQAKMVARKPDWEAVCGSVWRWLGWPAGKGE